MPCSKPHVPGRARAGAAAGVAAGEGAAGARRLLCGAAVFGAGVRSHGAPAAGDGHGPGDGATGILLITFKGYCTIAF